MIDKKKKLGIVGIPAWQKRKREELRQKLHEPNKRGK